MRQTSIETPSAEEKIRLPVWARVYGAMMYTLAVLWLTLIIEGATIPSITCQSERSAMLSAASPLMFLWHLVLGYYAYRSRPWIPLACWVTLAIDIGPFVMAYLFDNFTR